MLTVQFHLGILQRFRQLYESVENSALTKGGKPANVQEFLVSAEARYIRYLQLLGEFAGSNDSGSKRAGPEFLDAMPLPPWYENLTAHGADNSGTLPSYSMPIVSIPTDFSQT
jgi:hypothetical protein